MTANGKDVLGDFIYFYNFEVPYSILSEIDAILGDNIFAQRYSVGLARLIEATRRRAVSLETYLGALCLLYLAFNIGQADADKLYALGTVGREEDTPDD